MAKSKKAPRLTSFGARKKAERDHSAMSKEQAKLDKKIASIDNELSKTSTGSVIKNAYRMDLIRLRAKFVRERNSINESISAIESRIDAYNANDEAVLRNRGLFWGA